MERFGTHCIVDMYGCPFHLLDDERFVKNVLVGAVEEGEAELIGAVSHRFHPQGVTALGLLSESHVSIHTWPENGYVGADIFTCGRHARPDRACDYLIRAFRAQRHTIQVIPRGLALPQSAHDPQDAREPSSTGC